MGNDTSETFLDAEGLAKILTRGRDNNNPHAPPSGPAQWLFEGPPAESKLLAADLKLPKVGGIEVLRRLRTDERTELVPVVVLTSSHEDRDMIETYNLGANSYIVKPVEFENFSQAVSNMGMYWLLLNEPPIRKPS